MLYSLRSEQSVVPLAILLLLTSGLLHVAAQNDSGFKFLEVKVVDPDGKPLADVPVDIRIDGAAFPMSTDEHGVIAFNVPAGDRTRLELKVTIEGYVGLGARWREGQEIPSKFTIPLRIGAEIGGVVHDELGQPIEGVEVDAGIFDDDSDGPNAGKGQLRPALRGVICTTDATGKWRYSGAPKSPVNMQFRFSHPDFVSGRGYSRHGWNWEELQAQDQILVLEKGVEIGGRIVNPRGEPVVGAKVAVGSSRFDSARQIVATNEAGEYQLINLKPGPIILTVSAPDWAPDLRHITVASQNQFDSVDFQLQPPQTVRIRVIDPDGQPLAGVTILPENWRGLRSLEDPFGRKQTNDLGIWEWHAAPADEVQYSIFARGRFSLPDSRAGFLPADEVQDIVMYPAAIITGDVTEKATGEPIKTFRYVEGVWWDVDDTRFVLQRTSSTKLGTGGTFQFQMDSGCVKYLIQVEAEGYRTSRSREILPEEGSVHLEFELEPSKNISGLVELPNGEPAEGAQVVAATLDRGVYPYNGEIGSLERFPHAITDAEGRYNLPNVEAEFRLVILHEFGVAHTNEAELDASDLVVLQPWARVEGKITPGARDANAPQAAITVSDQDSQTENGTRIAWFYRKQIDESGDFVIERVPPTSVRIGSAIHFGDPGRRRTETTHVREVKLEPGETTTVMIGGTGHKIRGRLTMPPEYGDEIPWHRGCVKLTERIEGDLVEAHSTYRKTFIAPLARDGSFEIDDVLPGQYELNASVHTLNASGGRWKVLASTTRPCTIPASASEIAEGEYDLGILELELADQD